MLTINIGIVRLKSVDYIKYICHDEASLQSFRQCYIYINVLHSSWFDMCTMWFVVLLS